MMFKAIYKHTKPLKHANTNELHKKTICSNILTDDHVWKHFSRTPEVIICMRDFLAVSDFLKNTQNFKITKKCWF